MLVDRSFFARIAVDLFRNVPAKKRIVDYDGRLLRLLPELPSVTAKAVHIWFGISLAPGTTPLFCIAKKVTT
ncbi:MAG TPA: hypothetical protein VGN12_05265 [Pirellulales bacterium]